MSRSTWLEPPDRAVETLGYFGQRQPARLAQGANIRTECRALGGLSVHVAAPILVKFSSSFSR